MSKKNEKKMVDIKLLGDIIASRTDLPVKLANAVVTDVFESIAFLISEGYTVRIKNFGDFHSPPVEEGAMQYSAMLGREVPKKKQFRFKPHQKLKEKINGV